MNIMMKTAGILLATTVASLGHADNDDAINLLLNGNSEGIDICSLTAEMQRQSASAEITEELYVAVAHCYNYTDYFEQFTCIIDTYFDFIDAVEEVEEVYDARLDLCDLLGGGAYDPDIDPDDFSTVIDNPYLPYPVGASWTYHGETEDGLEVIEVTVLKETREIMGVECLSVRDTVTIDGELIEDTIDWFAQDEAGNVWYFGEISLNYEDGFIADIEGSWLSGVDGAKPGIVMLADPVPGITYRQEWLLGEAEDAATVLDDDASIEIKLGIFNACIQTADFLPPEPDELEHKFYAPGIGLIFETKPGEDESVELVSYQGL